MTHLFLLITSKFLIHLEEAGDDFALGGVFGEAVGFEDGGIVGAVGFAEFGGALLHRHIDPQGCYLDKWYAHQELLVRFWLSSPSEYP